MVLFILILLLGKKETQYSTHYLTHSLKKDVREKLKADGIRLPIMGNMTIKK